MLQARLHRSIVNFLVGVTAWLWLVAIATPADATIVVRSFNIQASAFVGNGVVTPVDPIFLDITLTFDDAASFGGTTSGLTVNSTNVPFGLEFSYDQSGDIVIIATYTPAPLVCNDPPNSFCAVIRNALASSPSLSVVTESPSTGNLWVAQDTLLQASDVRSVPEPTTWAMILIGFGAIGFAMRFRRRRPVIEAT